MDKTIIKFLVLIIMLLLWIIYILSNIIDKIDIVKTDTGRNYRNILEINK